MKIPAIKGFDQQAFEKYLKNTFWLMLGRVLSMLVGFVIARYLGPGSFGDLSFAVAFTGIFAAIGTLGLDSFVIRELIHTPEERDEILGTAFWMRIAVNLLLIPIAVLLYILFREVSTVKGSSLGFLVGLCAFASLFKSFNIIDSYFQSQVKSKYVVHVQNVCLLISASVKVAFMLLKLPVIYFALALLADGMMLAIGLIVIYHYNASHRIFRWQFSVSRAKSLLKQSWPLIMTAVMISLYMQIDVVMLKTLGSRAVGIYSAAVSISSAWYFIPVAVVTSVFPAVLHARKTDLERYQQR